MHWENLEGTGGEGGGTGDWDGENMETHGCFISMYDKTYHNLKKRKKEKKRVNVMSYKVPMVSYMQWV